MRTFCKNRRNTRLPLLTAALFALLFTLSQAHELESNRITLVLREPTHLVVTFHLNFIDALHQAVAPNLPFDEFLVVYSTMQLRDLQGQLNRVQQSVQSTILLTRQDQVELKLQNWQWPDAAAVQDQLRQHLMQAVAAPDARDVQPQMEVHADAVSSVGIVSARLLLPVLLKNAVVVWYRVNQTVVESGHDSAEMKF